MHKLPVYKQWISCGLILDNPSHFYTLSTERVFYIFNSLGLYNFHTQIINNLRESMHKFFHYRSFRGGFINLSTQSTRPIEANFNNLIKGLIV
jgi:hypothetical protein